MSCASASKKSAFTLLEIMLAVWIMALVTISMFRFMDSNLQAIRISLETGAREEALRSLAALVRAELGGLPPALQGALLGEAHIFQGVPADELRWKCEAGNGLLTANADGEYEATLTVRRDSVSGASRLSLRRVRVDGQDDASKESWRDLMERVDGIEFRYFDSHNNSWVDNWNDASGRPALVRMRVWRDKDAVPYEAVFPASRAQSLPSP